MNPVSEGVSDNQSYKELLKSEKVNQQLQEILNHSRIRVQVFGVGGAGNNSVTHLRESSIEGIETIAVNTDAQDLLCANADFKLLIGEELTGGLGAGNNPEVGTMAAQESLEEIEKVISADMVFIVCGLGGGTGTGATPVIAEAARKSGALTISFCFLPFLIEGRKRWQNAVMGLKNLYNSSDAVIIIPNERLLEVSSKLSLTEAFKLADEVLIKIIKSLVEMVIKPGLVNVDLADVRTVIKNSGISFISVGESNGNDRASRAVENALMNPIVSSDIQSARAALINICGDQSLTLAEAELVVRKVAERLNPDAEIIWGAIIEPDLKDTLLVTIVVGSVSFPHVEQLIINFDG